MVSFAFAGDPGHQPTASGGSETSTAPIALDVRANSFLPSLQDSVAVAIDAQGAAVVTWQSRRQEDFNYGVFAQRFDARGRPVGGEVKINLYSKGPQTQPCVALDGKGSAWFAWESLDQDGDLGGVFARRLDGRLETGTDEVLVNASTEGHQGEVALASDPSGRALVAWTGPFGQGRAVFASLLDGSGVILGSEQRLSEVPEDSLVRAVLPSVARDPKGGWLVVWSHADDRGVPQSILARHVGDDGQALGDVWQVAGSDLGRPVEPAVAFSADGRLAVAWLAAALEDYVPALRTFERGERTGAWSPSASRSVPTQCPGYSSGLDLAFDAQGRLALAWSSYGDAERNADTFLRWIASDGEIGAPVRATAAVSGHQRLAVGAGGRRLAVAQNGVVAVAWSGDAGQGDESGAHLSLIGADAAFEGQPFDSPVLAAETFGEPDLAASPHEPPVRVKPTQVILNHPLSQGGPDFGFNGIPQTGLTPPDPQLAVGPNHIVQVVNDSVAWYTKSGTQQSVQTQQAFFQNSGFMFDAEAIWDPLSNRFMVMTNNRSGGLSIFELAVSDDSDPNGTWFRYHFDVTALAGGSSSIDSPNIGVDGTAVYLTADFPPFSTGSFLIFIVEKAPLLVGGANPITRSLFIGTSQSWGTPVMHSSAAGYYLVQGLETASANQIVLHAITNPLGAPVLTSFNLNVPAYSAPEDPPQLGSSVRPETFEARFWSCVFRNGRMFATHHQGSARVLQRWYEINMGNWPQSGTPTLVQSGDVDLGAGIRTFFGSVVADGQGNIALTYARSSPSEFISMSRSYRLAGDLPGTLTPSVFMRQSTAPTPINRWGDYSGTVADPNANGVFWGTHEYYTNAWATWIGVYGPCQPTSTYCTGKITSVGTVPSIGSANLPSLGTNNFLLTVTQGPPNNNGLVYYGTAPNSQPFFNGFLCVQPPLLRSPVVTLDGAGQGQVGFPITVDLMGSKRYLAWWMRDPAHPDGTNVTLSNALEVTFCP
jgi:hypothetical protein